MIEVTPSLFIDEADLAFDYIRASGPGGQNVNKVATAVQLRYNPSALPDEIRARLARLAGSRLTAEGAILIEAKRYRTQEQNRADAIARLVHLVWQAAQPPVPRKATRPTLASKQKRLEQKRRRSTVKTLRRSPASPDEG